VVFDQILQFEKTPCPFKRSFTVRLPERPKTPVVKKPWAPVQGPLPPMSTPDFEMSPSPKPKSLRSAEKKSVARRSSAARDQTPIKVALDGEGKTGRNRSISAPKPSDAPVESTTVKADKTEQTESVEEERGRTLSRMADVVAVGVGEKPSPVPEPTPQAETTQGPDADGTSVAADPATEKVVLEKQAEIEIPTATEEKLEETGTTQKREETPVTENSSEQLEVAPPDTLQQHTTKEPTPTLEEDVPEASSKEQPPSSSLDATEDITPRALSLINEPRSADSSAPQTVFAETFSLPPQKGITTEEAAAQAKEVFSADAPLESAPEQRPFTENPAQAEPATDMAHALSEDEATPKGGTPEQPMRTTPIEVSQRQATIASPVGLATVAEEAAAPVVNTKRLSLRSDIFEGIRPYDQKSAAGTVTSLEVASRSPTNADFAHSFGADDDRKSFTSQDSTADSFEEQGLEASGEASIHEGSGMVGARRKKLRGFRGSRSLVVPPQLTLVTSPPSKAATKQAQREQSDESIAATSPTDSQDSFHSVQSWHSPITPLPPSPPVSDPTTPSTFPYPHNNILIPKRPSRYEISDLTVTPETRHTWDAASTGTHDSSQESAATAPDIATESLDKILAENTGKSTALTSQRPGVRHRATTSTVSVNRRTLSPLPSPANLFSPPATSSRRRQPRIRPMELARRVPMAIVAKTCEILLSPPSHLVNLMLRVAGMIAAGEWRGMIFGHGEGGESIPVHWDYSDGELSGDDDEYYMSQTEASRAGSVADRNELIEVNSGRGWEVD
jgi:hypothetical protein